MPHAPSGTVPKNRNPSPPPPVAGKKRALQDASAHTFDNVKLPKIHILVGGLCGSPFEPALKTH